MSGTATKREVLVGLHAARRGEPVVVVEGSIDAVVCGPGFVSPLGAGLSPEQAALLATAQPSEAVILFDPDDAGRKGAQRARERLSPYMRTTVAECPPGRDPADLGREHALSIVADYAGRRVPALGRLRRPTIRRHDLRSDIGFGDLKVP